MFNPILLSGMILVNGALILYTLGFIFEMKTKEASSRVLAFFTAGIILDMTSTSLMIVGTGKFRITPHGLLGYSALTLMLLENLFLRCAKRKSGKITRSLNIYSIAAFTWWVLAYIAGILLVSVFRHR